MMKKRIIDRIEYIRKETNNFNTNIWKWQNLSFNNILLKDIKFEKLSKSNLLFIFELIIKQYYS